MAFHERRGVDDSFHIRSEGQLYQGDARDDEDTTYHPTRESSPAAGSSLAPPPKIDPFPLDDLPVFHHLDKGGRISKIDSLRHSLNENVDIQSEGLYLVSNPATEHVIADVVFVYGGSDYGSHPYYDWLNKTAPGGKDYLPDDVKSYIPLARVWAYGFQIHIRDYHPFSSSANNFLVYYEEQRRRDRRNNPGMDDAMMPKLVFICVGLGGLVVKKILLDCLQSGSSTQESFSRSCQGIAFIDTPHLPDHVFLASASSIPNIDPKRFLGFDLKYILRETRTVNEAFLKDFAEMPSTFCLVNQRQMRFLPGAAYATFPSHVRRKGRDAYLIVTENERNWRNVLHGDHRLFVTIMTHVRGWVGATDLEPLPPSLPPRTAQVTDGINLLSIDGGGIRGLASLLILERLMQEIARIERAADPSTANKHRIPADYFDLAGGTSTGGLICIMLFRLRMDAQSAIVEYRRLSPKIFRPSPTKYLGSDIVKTAFGMPWFDGQALEAGVKGIVKDRLSWEEKESMRTRVSDATLISSIDCTRDESCKTFVCALRKEDNSAVRFRAYLNPDGSQAPFADCKIWEAARATSAAPFYFPTAVVEGVKFWDGGLANNNPVLEVLAERSLLFPQRPVNCMISLGTGFSERKPSKSTIAVLGKGKRVLKNVTNVENDHERAREQCQVNSIPYFRFNPSTADDEIGLADYKLLEALTMHTEKYLEIEQIKTQIKQCAELTHQRAATLQIEAMPVDATPQEGY